MKKQNIEDIFSSMEDFSSVPPPELWSQIEEKLDKPKKKKRAILWWSAAACLLLGLMLPSILHFSSNSDIKNIHNTIDNSVVDGKKENTNSNKNISTPENTINTNATNNEIVTTEDHTTSKNNSDTALDSQKIKTEKNVVVQAENETKNNPVALDSKLEVKKANHTATEKAVASGKENILKANQSNAFNAASKNQFSTDNRKATNSAVAEKTFKTNTANGFNSNTKNQFLSTDKKVANQILAEKTFNAGKTNAFNSNAKNQVSNSIFKDPFNSKNSNNVAVNSYLNGNAKGMNEGVFKQNNETIVPSKELANNQKSNSKFTTVLSKQDSVQLAELQNLEKGILTPESPKEKSDKKIGKGEKWALEVFAGLANSENYKNDKTLGNVNDSKQGSTYGVKTKYKINNKWAVGSGLKINELGQSIANISYTSANGASAPNSSYSSNDYLNQPALAASSLQLSTNSGYIFVSTSTTNALKQNNIQNSSIENGKLDQSLRYIEMPLEVSYSVFNKNKATINLNTGGFVGKLISNNMALNGNSIGENINANDYVYGSTLSSTIQYRVYKKTSVFVEPAMNYYLNPLNNQSFNQFQWGLNFGLNVSF